MLAQFSFMPDQAATISEKVDLLYFYISAITGGVGILISIALVYFCAKYRRRSAEDETPRILGSHRLELIWTITPLVIFLTFFGWGVVVYQIGLQPPADAPEVFVVGKQWMWKIQHPTGQREINELHLPVGRPVKITLISEDVIHSFGIPAFRDKIDVLPGRFVSTWYKPTKVGRYFLFCDQLCGVGHSQMVGSIVVMRTDDYDRWIAGEIKDIDQPPSPTSGPTDGSLAWEGRKLFLKLQCITCHGGTATAHAPRLEGIWGQEVPIRNGRPVRVDEGYIRESILKPRAKIHEGWEPIMPTFQGQVSEEDIIKLIAFIKSLRVGDTPFRNEDFPAPVGAPTQPTESKQ